MDNETKNIFENGATWLRADFHLHTKADPQGLQYNGEGNRFFEVYLEALEKADIKVGVIANHNRLYLDEFKELHRKAINRDIWLFPGIELCINEGGNDVHVIICFKYEDWIDNNVGINKIQQFESFAFENKSWSASQCSNFNLIGLIKKLNGYHADYFIIPAHVDSENGLFYETERGKRNRNFWETDDFKLIQERVLGFQKVRKTETKEEIQQLFKNSDFRPAFVEGCDPKKIDDIGRGEKTYIKIGSKDFNTLKYVLKHSIDRIKSETPAYNYSYIQSIQVIGNEKSRLQHLNLTLKPELNCLIGGKGAGKSSILEVIRYCLGLRAMVEIDKQDTDKKLDLIRKGLADGGKAILSVSTPNGIYTVEREHNGPVIIKQNNQELSIPISELFSGHEPVYFGQKDLSEGERKKFNELFLEKLVPSHLLKEIRESIRLKSEQIRQTIQDKKKLEKGIGELPEVHQEIAKYTHRIKLFEEKGILEKLNKEIEFSRDADKIAEAIEFSRNFFKDIDEIISKYDFYFGKLKAYQSKVAQGDFKKFLDTYHDIFTRFEKLKSLASSLRDNEYAFVLTLIESQKQFSEIVKGFRDEFAEIKRSITDNSVNPSDYTDYVKRLNLQKQKKEVLESYKTKITQFEMQLDNQLHELELLWEKEYDIIRARALYFNNIPGAKLTFNYRQFGDRASLKEKLKQICYGSRLTADGHYEQLSENFKTAIDIYRDLKTGGEILSQILNTGNYYQNFENCIYERLDQLITYQTPDSNEIKFEGKTLSDNFSLGEKASALISFILKLEDYSLVIIDQPEDDLDTLSLYENIIKVLIEKKNTCQFIFATHNANIPVLGDSELVISCSFDAGKISTITGSIDNSEIQDRIINIMEGGRDAFNKRNDTYTLWKPLK